MSKLSCFIEKYDFPAHLFVIYRVILLKLRFSIWSTYNFIVFRLMGVVVPFDFRADSRVHLRICKRGQIRFGKSVSLIANFGTNPVGLHGPCALDCGPNGRIMIGDYSGGSSVVLSSRAEISIASNVKLGANVRVFDHDFHSLNYEHRRARQSDLQGVRAKPICIGDDVFVGANAIILKGVHIGERAIIGAGSVVTKDVPADEVWVGNPARSI